MANLNLVTKIYAFFNADLLLRCNFSSITVVDLGGGEGQEPPLSPIFLTVIFIQYSA